MQLLKLQYTEKMSRFRWSLYSPTNKSKLAFKFWHPRVHDYCTILCSRPSCVSRNTNKFLQQFLCTSAKNFMLIIGSAPVNLFYFSAKNERVSIARLVVFTYRSMACMHWIGVLLDLWKSDFFIGDPKMYQYFAVLCSICYVFRRGVVKHKRHQQQSRRWNGSRNHSWKTADMLYQM